MARETCCGLRIACGVLSVDFSVTDCKLGEPASLCPGVVGSRDESRVAYCVVRVPNSADCGLWTVDCGPWTLLGRLWALDLGLWTVWWQQRRRRIQQRFHTLSMDGADGAYLVESKLGELDRVGLGALSIDLVHSDDHRLPGTP